MPDSPPSSILPPPGEVNVLPATVQHVAGGAATLTGISWNAEGHVALSIRGEGVRLIASPAELRAFASLMHEIADAVDTREGRPVATARPVPALPTAGVLDIELRDSVLEAVRQPPGDARLTGVMVAAPGALILAADGAGLRLTFRDRADLARLMLALEAVDAHLAHVEAGAGAALEATLARAEAAGHA
jgi:hypothetical protein